MLLTEVLATKAEALQKLIKPVGVHGRKALNLTVKNIPIS